MQGQRTESNSGRYCNVLYCIDIRQGWLDGYTFLSSTLRELGGGRGAFLGFFLLGFSTVACIIVYLTDKEIQIQIQL